MHRDGAQQVADDETLLRLVHPTQVVPDGAGGLRLSSAALTFPLVATSDDLAGVSVYLEGTVKALGRRAADLIGARTFDEVWFANAGVVDAEAPGGVVEDPVDQGFWADPAHALIVTPAEVGRSALKNLARRLAPHFSALEPSEDR